VTSLTLCNQIYRTREECVWPLSPIPPVTCRAAWLSWHQDLFTRLSYC
jgi:hypothetical protein